MTFTDRISRCRQEVQGYQVGGSRISFLVFEGNVVMLASSGAHLQILLECGQWIQTAEIQGWCILSESNSKKLIYPRGTQSRAGPLLNIEKSQMKWFWHMASPWEMFRVCPAEGRTWGRPSAPWRGKWQVLGLRRSPPLWHKSHSYFRYSFYSITLVAIIQLETEPLFS